MNFRSFIESESTLKEGQEWKAKRADVIKLWQNIRPYLPVDAETVPTHYDGTRYRFDGILINLPGRPDNVLDGVVQFNRTDDGELLTWANGDITFIPWNDNAQFYPADPSKPSRADFVTIDPDNLDSLDDLSGYIWNTVHIQAIAGKTQPGLLTDIPPYFFKTLDLVKGLVADEVSVHGEVFSPLTYYMELFGYADALMTFIQDPPKVHALLDRLTDTR